MQQDTFCQYTSIKVSGDIIKLNTQDIILFEASDKYVKVVTIHRAYLMLDTIKKLEKGLFPHLFCRVNRSCIVNIHHVIKLKKDIIEINKFEVFLHKDYYLSFIQRLNVLN